MEYYFQPTLQAYTAVQIKNIVGFDPSISDDEVLNFHGIYRVVDKGREKNIFDSPQHFSYEIDGCCARKVSAGVSISLEEAKVKTRSIVIQKAENQLSLIREISGLPPELFYMILQQAGDGFADLKAKVSELVSTLESTLQAIENTNDEEFLKNLCILD